MSADQWPDHIRVLSVFDPQCPSLKLAVS
jgi:hypothetical protein